MKTIIRNDQTGTIRGYRNDTGNRIYIEDLQGKNLGWYDKSNNITCNRSGARIGKGDQTFSLLED